jgi:hypothetical protein
MKKLFFWLARNGKDVWGDCLADEPGQDFAAACRHWERIEQHGTYQVLCICQYDAPLVLQDLLLSMQQVVGDNLLYLMADWFVRG